MLRSWSMRGHTDGRTHLRNGGGVAMGRSLSLRIDLTPYLTRGYGSAVLLRRNLFDTNDLHQLNVTPYVARVYVRPVIRRSLIPTYLLAV